MARRRGESRPSADSFSGPMRATSLVLLLHLLLAGCEVSFTTGDEDVLTDSGPDKEREEALALAQRFLALLDAGAVAETYPLASTAIQEQQGRMTWELTIGGLRRVAGAFETRELSGYGYTKELSDAPPGSYFVIEYQTTFAGSLFHEKVVVGDEPAGWRIAGYFLSRRFRVGDGQGHAAQQSAAGDRPG